MLHGSELRRPVSRAWYWLTMLSLMLALSLSGFPNRGSAVNLFAQDEKEAATEEPAAEGEPAADKAAAPTDAPAAEEESYLVWLYNASGPFGICIGIESFILVALIVMSVMQLRRDVFIPPAFVEGFEQKLTAKDYQGAYEIAKKDESFLARMMAGGLGKLSRGYEEAQQGMQEVAEDENMAIDHKLSYISLIGTTAPMLGLLGTVQGMVAAFSVIARSATSPKPSELANGITLALVTTLEGLIVAIPAIVSFALFKNRQARLVMETALVAEGLMSRFASVGKRPAGATTTSAPAPAAPAQ